MWARLEAADRGELERLARVGPVAAAAAAFRRAVAQQEAVTELVRRAADGEVEGVLADRRAIPRSPADVRDPRARTTRRPGRTRPAPSRRSARRPRSPCRRPRSTTPACSRRQRGLDVALEPLVAQVLVDAWLLRVVVERVGEAERAPAGVEVERPLDARRQAGRPLLGLVVRRLGRVLGAAIAARGNGGRK